MESSLSIRFLPRFSKEEIRGLWALHRQGDPDARDRLVLANLGIVVKVAKGFRGNGLDHDDILQEGVIGLLDAIDSWRPGEHKAFSTRAWYQILKSILHAIDWTGHTIRVPQGAPPVPTVSIFSSLHDEEGDCIADRLADQVPGLDDVAEENDTANVLDQVLRSLPELEETILRRHYGIGVQECTTLEVIGKELGISRQRVHAIEKKALWRLRRRKEVRALAGGR